MLTEMTDQQIDYVAAEPLETTQQDSPGGKEGDPGEGSRDFQGRYRWTEALGVTVPFG